MDKPLESHFVSHVAYTRALEEYADLLVEKLRVAEEALNGCVCAMQDYQAGIGIPELFDKSELLGRKALIKIREVK